MAEASDELPEGFDADGYYRLNPDVRRAGMDAAEHYLRFGRAEGRRYRLRTFAPHEKHCAFCHNAVDAWLPYPDGRSEFVRLVDGIGTNTERCFCPHCRCIDRERHLYLFLDRCGALASIPGSRVLHVAPEGALGNLVRSLEPAQYVRGDLSPADAETERVDVEAIPFPAETFDLAICNHTLEHVKNPRRALAELHRVLRPGARLVCQTPYAERLTMTFEEPLLQTPQARVYLYGQADHLRMFGRDIEQLVRASGFTGRLVPHAELLPDIDAEASGVNEREPFFDFRRS